MNYDPSKKPKYYDKPALYHPFCRGLMGWWMLNEGGGSTVYDSRRLFPGSFGNAPTWQDGALYFDGSDDYVSVGSGGFIPSGDKLSIAAWVRYDVDNAVNKDILSHGEQPITFANVYAFRLTTTELLRLFTKTTSGGVNADSSSSLTLGQWHHVAGVYDGSTARVYIDGILDGTPAAQSGTFADNNQLVLIGAFQDFNPTIKNFFPGDISDVRIYDRALSAQEVYAQYLNALTAEYAEFPGLDIRRFFMSIPPVGLSIPVAMRYYRNLRVG